MSLVRFLTIPPLFKAGMLSLEGVWLDRLVDRVIRRVVVGVGGRWERRALVSMLTRKVSVSATGVFATF